MTENLNGIRIAALEVNAGEISHAIADIGARMDALDQNVARLERIKADDLIAQYGADGARAKPYGVPLPSIGVMQQANIPGAVPQPPKPSKWVEVSALEWFSCKGDMKRVKNKLYVRRRVQP